MNYARPSALKRVWVLWNADDAFFTPRKAHLNLRTILPAVAQPNIDILFEAKAAVKANAVAPALPSRPVMVKAGLRGRWVKKKAGA